MSTEEAMRIIHDAICVAAHSWDGCDRRNRRIKGGDIDFVAIEVALGLMWEEAFEQGADYAADDARIS